MQTLFHSVTLQKKKSTKAIQSLSKFKYYCDQLFPELFQNHDKHANDFNLKSKSTENNMTYLMGNHTTQEVGEITLSLFLTALSKNYFCNGDLLRIDQSYYKEALIKNSGGYFNSSSVVSELLEFHIETITETQYGKTFTQKNINSDGNLKQKLLESVKSPNKNRQRAKNQHKSGMNCESTTFNVYVLHHNHNSNKESSSSSKSIKWQNFIQKYEVTPKQVHYSVVCSLVSEPSSLFSLNYFSSKSENLIKMFLQQNYFSMEFQNKIIGTSLQLKESFKQILTKIDDPAFSDEHRRILRLPTEYYSIYTKLRKHFGQKSSENQVCRFLLAKCYNYEDTLKALQQYHQWKDQMKSKYTLQDFKFFLDLNLFIYLGQDKKGRPLILNRASKCMIKTYDEDMYNTFYIYWLQIYLPTKMRGYVDQLVILADVSNLSMDNFKISVTSRNIKQSLAYSPERQVKLFAIYPGNVGFLIWRILKPLLPTKTHDKVVVCGNDTQQILKEICNDIDIDVIPTYIGGNNDIPQLRDQNIKRINKQT